MFLWSHLISVDASKNDTSKIDFIEGYNNGDLVTGLHWLQSFSSKIFATKMSSSEAATRGVL